MITTFGAASNVGQSAAAKNRLSSFFIFMDVCFEGREWKNEERPTRFLKSEPAVISRADETVVMQRFVHCAQQNTAR